MLKSLYLKNSNSWFDFCYFYLVLIISTYIYIMVKKKILVISAISSTLWGFAWYTAFRTFHLAVKISQVCFKDIIFEEEEKNSLMSCSAYFHIFCFHSAFFLTVFVWKISLNWPLIYFTWQHFFLSFSIFSANWWFPSAVNFLFDKFGSYSFDLMHYFFYFFLLFFIFFIIKVLALVWNIPKELG